jgi:hypothetical protein
MKKVLGLMNPLAIGKMYVDQLFQLSSKQEINKTISAISALCNFQLQIRLKIMLIFASLFISLPFSTLSQPDFEKTICCSGYSLNDSLMFIRESLQLEPVSGCQFPLLCQIGSSIEKYPDLLADVRLTLSYYPELQGANIKVYYSSIKQTMNSRPCFRNLFVKKGKRTYRIIINNNTGKEKGFLLQNYLKMSG